MPKGICYLTVREGLAGSTGIAHCEYYSQLRDAPNSARELIDDHEKAILLALSPCIIHDMPSNLSFIPVPFPLRLTNCRGAHD